MDDGRLIRVGKYRGDAKAVVFIVAIANPSKPVDLIREKAADPRKFRSADGSLSRCSAIHRR
jgi:hypothetical protein